MTTMATRFDPTSAEAQFLYGRVLLGKAKTPEAIAAFKKCLELDPTFGRAKMYLEGMGELKEDN
jgi:cytochrome c-type biogenesis protein CcmH/NrfG